VSKPAAARCCFLPTLNERKMFSASLLGHRALLAHMLKIKEKCVGRVFHLWSQSTWSSFWEKGVKALCKGEGLWSLKYCSPGPSAAWPLPPLNTRWVSDKQSTI